MLQSPNRTSNWKHMPGFCLFALCLLFPVPSISASADTDAAKKASPAESSSAVSTATIAPIAPFAKVYLALKGCTSCAACRSTIRQMTKGAAKDGKVSLPGDGVEVRYAKPTTIPLKKVVGNLAKNRLHDLKLVDVLFDASGQIHADSSGSLLFTIETTGQQYSISIPAGVSAPPRDEPLRLSAVLRGLRASNSDLSLELKSFTVNNRQSES